jgi:hypothetical protein
MIPESPYHKYFRGDYSHYDLRGEKNEIYDNRIIVYRSQPGKIIDIDKLFKKKINAYDNGKPNQTAN